MTQQRVVRTGGLREPLPGSKGQPCHSHLSALQQLIGAESWLGLSAFKEKPEIMDFYVTFSNFETVC